MFTRLQSWVILTDYLDNYPVFLDSEKNSKKFQIFKKMQMKLGATQINPNLALCHNTNEKNLKNYKITLKITIFSLSL